ncbi:hypothetical protein B0J12DRAFT_139407 [Macrophomina phaseolina]|uniref:Uncharacterized protein n=1 Tax=Macrophomina phaseolina TaxID=35725 RepID=A0ABQ8GA88_9PEZI|nr:hypothetical protein B0J12DRAFT_139407 [Macrophomina phaseolina]
MACGGRDSSMQEGRVWLGKDVQQFVSHFFFSCLPASPPSSKSVAHSPPSHAPCSPAAGRHPQPTAHSSSRPRLSQRANAPEKPRLASSQRRLPGPRGPLQSDSPTDASLTSHTPTLPPRPGLPHSCAPSASVPTRHAAAGLAGWPAPQRTSRGPLAFPSLQQHETATYPGRQSPPTLVSPTASTSPDPRPPDTRPSVRVCSACLLRDTLDPPLCLRRGARWRRPPFPAFPSLISRNKQNERKKEKKRGGDIRAAAAT